MSFVRPFAALTVLKRAVLDHDLSLASPIDGLPVHVHDRRVTAMTRGKASSLIRAAILPVFLALAGCNSMPPFNFAPQFSGPSQTKIDADLRSVSVTLATPEEKVGAMPQDAALAPPIWRDALQDALNKSALFDDDSHRRVNIAVKVLMIDIPNVGVTFETHVDARYQVIDRKDGRAIYDRVISSTGTVPFDWAFAGVIRRRESINRAVRNNIASFMNSLYTGTVASQ